MTRSRAKRQQARQVKIGMIEDDDDFREDHCALCVHDDGAGNGYRRRGNSEAGRQPPSRLDKVTSKVFSVFQLLRRFSWQALRILQELRFLKFFGFIPPSLHV